jgi:hypothetical protein
MHEKALVDDQRFFFHSLGWMTQGSCAAREPFTNSAE